MDNLETRWNDRFRSTVSTRETSTFTITVRFGEGLNERQRSAFRKAADRWCSVIVGGLTPVEIDGETIQNLLIDAEGLSIDGVGRVLGQAGPLKVRPETAERGALLPAKGRMQFDTADLERIERNGKLDDVITHEMGHVLGIGTVWHLKKLVNDLGGENPTFLGPAAMREYASLRGRGNEPLAVPLENTGGPESEGSHWREAVLRDELMSGTIRTPNNPLSRLTIASLEDMGYVVDFDAADEYALPDPIERGVTGRIVTRKSPSHADGVVLPLFPTVLPAQSLR